MHTRIRAGLLAALLSLPAAVARGDGLSGSPGSMVNQHRIAVEEDYSFLRSPKEVMKLASAGALVPVAESGTLALSKVSYPYARPEVRDFVQRFAARYRDSVGSRLVVTSLTRPASTQPANAHKLSVHPAGMAADLRVPADSAARAFVERSLLAMEKAGAIDVTRERSPAHYHVAVFAEAYGRFAARQDSIDARARAQADSAAAVARAALPARAAAAPSGSSEGSALPGVVLAVLAIAGATLMYGSRRLPAGVVERE